MRVYHYNLHYYRKNYTYRLQSHIKNSLPDLHFTIKNSSCMNKYQAAINSREHILQATFTNDEDGRETTCCRQRIPVNCSRRQCLAPRSIPSAGQTQCCSSGVYQLTIPVPGTHYFFRNSTPQRTLHGCMVSWPRLLLLLQSGGFAWRIRVQISCQISFTMFSWVVFPMITLLLLWMSANSIDYLGWFLRWFMTFPSISVSLLCAT